MAYVDQAIGLWKYEQDRDENTRKQFGDALSTIAGGIQEDRKRALEAKRAKENQALTLSKDGVNPDDISAYQDQGNMSGVQQFYAGAYERNQSQKDLEKQRALLDGELDRRYKESQIAKNMADSKGENNLSFDAKEAIKAKYRAQNSQDKQPAQNEFAAAGYSKRARQAEADLAKLPEGTGTDWQARIFKYTPNEIASPDLQLLDQAKRNFISANLRKESGAAIPPDEMRAEEIKYFPQPGDSKDLIAQKARSREQAMLNLEAEGARALPRIGTAQAAPIDIAKKVQSYTPEQKAARRAELEAREAQMMAGQ